MSKIIFSSQDDAAKLLELLQNYSELEAKHTALVEAVEELMSLDYEDDFDQGKFFKAWGRVEKALATAQEADE